MHVISDNVVNLDLLVTCVLTFAICPRKNKHVASLRVKHFWSPPVFSIEMMHLVDPVCPSAWPCEDTVMEYNVVTF